MLSATFAALAVTMYAGHAIADHVLGQTNDLATTKDKRGLDGWAANIIHVCLYHLVLIPMLVAVIYGLDLPVSPAGWTVGIAISVVTHAVIDRRWPVRWLLERTGSAEFAALAGGGMNGMYLADQSLHLVCLWAAALVMAAV